MGFNSGFKGLNWKARKKFEKGREQSQACTERNHLVGEICPAARKFETPALTAVTGLTSKGTHKQRV